MLPTITPFTQIEPLTAARMMAVNVTLPRLEPCRSSRSQTDGNAIPSISYGTNGRLVDSALGAQKNADLPRPCTVPQRSHRVGEHACARLRLSVGGSLVNAAAESASAEQQLLLPQVMFELD